MKPHRSPRERALESRGRGPLRALALLIAAALTVAASLRSPSLALGQGHTPGSEKQGLINAGNEAERRAFPSLACTCGTCPHEPLSSCDCGFADRLRQDVRAMIASGMSLEQIKDEWVKRYGSDSLTVPRNTGANQFLYIVPLVAIVTAAGFVIFALRHFRRREDERSRAATAGGSAPAPGAARDEYDDKLDDELRELDKDE